MRISDWSSDVCSSDLVEYAQAGVRGIARKQDHFHPRRLGGRAVVERDQLEHQREGDARLEHVVLAAALVLGLGVHDLRPEQGYSSAEGRVGKAWGRTCICRWVSYDTK